MTQSDSQRGTSSRRQFIQGSTAAIVGSSLLPTAARAVHTAGKATLRLGLVGCGGRGTGAAVQALTADPDTELVALADAFQPRLEGCLSRLQKSKVGAQVKVQPDRCFVGFDGYQNVIDADVDVVLLATPPHFRPLHLKACVDAGKHVFAEKPVAVDAPGVRSVLATAAEAKKKNLSIVSGLCWRYETGMQEMVQRLHDGAVGDIVALESMRYLGGVGKLAPRKPEWSDMEYHMQNWYYFTWLSGDFIVEQFVHELDKQSWVMANKYPISCTATGGRQTRIGEQYGHVYDHFSCVFEYDNGVKYYATTRHQRGCSNPFYDLVLGTKGRANLMKYQIEGEQAWRGPRKRTEMHQLEHNAMYAALRRGDIINNGRYMAHSTMLGIMGRMSAYTGQTLSWEQALNSQEDLSPPRYDWSVPLPDPPIAMPGSTKFV